MFYKNAANVLTGKESTESSKPRLVLMPSAQGKITANRALPELLSITARRCSSFFAEAAVLVLVFGVLDFFMLRGKIELGWVGGAFAISLCLLAASIATDFSARRWLWSHP
ncbi:hypothetical protein [Terriglobus saanensis]|uniref:Uncharacterized protein n=1 Tax=Terriglobus saanensis (strain ATCC BAA-1853 / DSM 23119 / SP1PR4) TaxID=401053 RepID=E8UXC7_TERSS|nr:hypothetical protein [Terriglobus saanensis]ADV84151.1 hypothetical protein AciPR4_3397 [Terriglobus saanensis SP1PR4]